jgi:Fe-S cluster biogenesis protein NfuA/rhodanese-related sulfurtransferase/glutaredoxin
MLGTLLHRVTVRTLDSVVERGRSSRRKPMRLAAAALDRTRKAVGLDLVDREHPLPEWTGQAPHRPMWQSDRKKLEKWRVDQGIADEAASAEQTAPAAETPVDAAPLKVFFKRGCPYSRATFELLREREVAYEEVDVTGDEQTLGWLKLVTGRRTTPQIFLHGEHVGGYDELRALDLDGELHRRVAGREEAERSDENDAEIDVAELCERLEDDPGGVLLLDVREPRETHAGWIEGAVQIPLAQLAARSSELDAQGVWIAYCATGKRSLTAVSILQGAGFRSVVSLRGGIAAWRAHGRDTVAGSTVRRTRLPVVHPERSPFEGLLDEAGPTSGPLEGTALVDRVREVLDECRPLVQADGGDIELLDVRDDVVHVQLTGNCIGCPSAQATLQQGIERRLRSRIPQIRSVASPQL